jgi:hypothetical protein
MPKNESLKDRESKREGGEMYMPRIESLKEGEIER